MAYEYEENMNVELDVEDTGKNRSESNVLLPCPFCGASVARCPCIADDPNTDCTRIACENCGVEAVWNLSNFEYNAERWNRRIDFSTIKGMQLVSENAIAYLHKEYPRIYDEFYKRL